MSMPAELLKPDLTLKSLLADIADAPAIPLSGISSDSRRLEEGNLFLAVAGANSHGLDFLDQALAAGVAAVVFDSDTGHAVTADTTLLPIAGLAGHIGTIADRWFDSPSNRMRVTGVTGTNGKTTVAWLIRESLQLLGQPCGYLGTLGSGIAELHSLHGMTTPACVELHRELAGFRAAGARHAAIEVSSHALEQDRVAGVHFDSAVFTNLSRDHIDYHGSMQSYGESKARLILDCGAEHRIVSLDTEFGQDLAERCGDDVVAVSTRLDQVANGRRFVFVRAVVANDSGSKVSVISSWGDREMHLPLPGEFNVANALQVLALLLCWEVSLADACDLMRQVSAPPGRMQRVRSTTEEAMQPAVYVDYAHTPASLEAALKALRQHSSGRLWCVFGCGGDRDRGKRAMMGKVAARLADRAVITNDNPRTEPPEEIFAGILEGMDGEPLVIEDRAAAIAHALCNAAENDVVLIAGKGHEDYQIIGSKRRAFSDYDYALASLVARANGSAVRS